MIEEKELTDNCIYTKWVKESQNKEDSMIQEDESYWEENSPESISRAADKLMKKLIKEGRIQVNYLLIDILEKNLFKLTITKSPFDLKGLLSQIKNPNKSLPLNNNNRNCCTKRY